MKLEMGKSYSVFIPSEQAPDGDGYFLEEYKEFTVVEKDKNEIKRQHFEHLLDDSWYYVINKRTNRKHWYFLQDTHVVNEIKTK